MRILDVNKLSISFSTSSSHAEVVKDVSFYIDKGEILALVGESGCGKSLSCLSLTRLIPSPPANYDGEIDFYYKGNKFNMLKLSEGQLRKLRGAGVSYIFQEPSSSLNPVFKIGDQIAEAIYLHRPEVNDVKGEVVSLLSQVGISAPEERLSSYPHELSGGMQQRVMIAMALASRPELLVADEPTTALDVTIQAQILELLNQLRQEHDMTVILVTHNLGIVSELADRVCVMYAGCIVESAPTKELFANPCHPYTKSLLRAVPTLGGEKSRLETIRGSVPSPENYPKGCRFFGRCETCDSLSKEQQLLCQTTQPENIKVGQAHHCACHYCGE